MAASETDRGAGGDLARERQGRCAVLLLGSGEVGASCERATALQCALPVGWRVLSAGAPGAVAPALADVVGAGIGRLVVVPVHPQFARRASGVLLSELYDAARGMPSMQLEVRASYPDDRGYVEALSQDTLKRALEHGAGPSSHELVFIPGAGIEDATDRELLADMTRTARLVALRLGWEPDRVAVAATRAEGLAHTPALVQELGVLPPPRGLDDGFTKMLVSLVRRGVHRSDASGPAGEPLLRASRRQAVERDVSGLAMLGVSVGGALPDAPGRGLVHCTADELRSLKRPHLEVVELLRSLSAEPGFAEGFVWGTCNRFELYFWAAGDGAESWALVERLRREVLGPGGEAGMNVLRGRDAWGHLLRSAAGLNSTLAGDSEVIDQLDAAVRTAHHAGSAGARCDALVADAQEAVREVRTATPWGEFGNRYCRVAMQRLRGELAAPLHEGQVLVLGGSTTSCSVLEVLRGEFGVPHERLSVIYRGERSGRLARRLHAGLPSHRVKTVETYQDPVVLRAISEADVVFLATDQREPVVEGGWLADARDLRARPMIVVDFNTLGSTSGARGIAGVTLVDARDIEARLEDFNRDALADRAFVGAAAAARSWIDARVGLKPRRVKPALPLAEAVL